MKLIASRIYLNDLEYLTELISDMPILDKKSFEFYEKTINLIDDEYKRIINELRKEEIKIIKKGKKKK